MDHGETSLLGDIARRGYTLIDVPAGLSALTRRGLDVASTLFRLSKSIKAACRADEERFSCGWREPPKGENPSEVWHVQIGEPDGFWPAELRQERSVVCELLDGAVRHVAPVLDDVARHYAGRGPADLASSLHRGESTLRLLKYEASEAMVRFPPHLDYGIATLFIGATNPGLELREPDGSWSASAALPERWLLCAGEMLNVLTGNKVPPVWHRVNGVPAVRYSLAVFVHPEPTYLLTHGLNGELAAGNYFAERVRQLRQST